MSDTRPFPRRVSIENTNACNARCTICPREKLTREIRIMDMPAYERLLDDCIRAGATKLSLHNFGEPLMDRDLEQKVALAKRKGIAETYIVTNASLMTPERARGLIEAGLDRVKISFYGLDRGEYEGIHAGLDYEKTLANVKHLLEAKRLAGGARPKITLRYIGGLMNFLRFRGMWRPYRRLCSVIPGRLHNYTTGRNYNPVSRVRRPRFMRRCRYLRRSVVYILVNGDVVPCCYDFNGILAMGNALRENIADIWNGERFREFRAAHRAHNFDCYPICAACDKLNYILI